MQSQSRTRKSKNQKKKTHPNAAFKTCNGAGLHVKVKKKGGDKEVMKEWHAGRCGGAH